MSAEEFLRCILTPAAVATTGSGGSSTDGTVTSSSSNSSSSVVSYVDGKWKTSSFYLDSSGRASISLPLQLKFRTREALVTFITTNCFNPPPMNYTTTGSSTNNLDDPQTNKQQQQADGSSLSSNLHTTVRSVGIEAKVTLTFGTGAAWKAIVEGVTIFSTRIGGDVNNDDDPTTGSSNKEDGNNTNDDANSIYFTTEIIIRVSKGQELNTSITSNTSTENDSSKSSGTNNNINYSGVKTNLEINAVYTERSTNTTTTNNNNDNTTTATTTTMIPRTTTTTGREAKKLLNIYNFTEYDTSVPDRVLKEYRLYHPLVLHVDLTHAVTIYVTSTDGPKMGQTFLSLSMCHSNTHPQPVTITSIALHPGHSTYQPYTTNALELENNNTTSTPLMGNTSMNTTVTTLLTGGTNANNTTNKKLVADMSKSVKWGYAPKSEPTLPLTLHPYETYTTIITVDASEDLYAARICSCPLSITALVGYDTTSTGSTNNTTDNNNNNDQLQIQHHQQRRRRYYVVAAVEAHWSTSPAAIEPADSFRIEMNFMNDTPYCIVGSTVTVLLDIYNLSSETRQLMLLVDNTIIPPAQQQQSTKPNEKPTSPTASPSRRSFINSGAAGGMSNTPKSLVVSEQGGHKFGVWGLSSRYTGSTVSPSSNNTAGQQQQQQQQRDTPEEKDQDLLAVDVALLLGEVKGHTSTKAKLRVIPLREGTIRIPNFKLVDSRSGQRYNCYHRLYAIVSQNNATSTTTNTTNLEVSSSTAVAVAE